MLVLTRKSAEGATMFFDRDTLLTLLAQVEAMDAAKVEGDDREPTVTVGISVERISGDKVRIGFTADPVIKILRNELMEEQAQDAVAALADKGVRVV